MKTRLMEQLSPAKTRPVELRWRQMAPMVLMIVARSEWVDAE